MFSIVNHIALALVCSLKKTLSSQEWFSLQLFFFCNSRHMQIYKTDAAVKRVMHYELCSDTEHSVTQQHET